VQGIYLCPVFKSRSLHKYDASDHRHIDPTLAHPGEYLDPGPGHNQLGPDEDPYDETTWAWTPADQWFVDEFLPKAKSLGLRVMLDGVWNHVGLDHFAFDDVRRNGSDSPYADWFQVVFDEQGKLIGWQGWSRVNGSLPEFRHIGQDIAPGPKAHVMAVTRRWMDPNGDGDPSDGIDGWRLDVAGEIGADFWKDWRGLVKSINPEALIVAEIWSDADEMLGPNAFDSQMNYPFVYAVADWLAIGSDGVVENASVVANRLERVFHHDPEIDLVQLNLMDSHDTERVASMMMNRWARGYDNESSRWFEDYEYENVDADARRRVLAAFATMVASPGAIMVYNGDEYAMPGADDPDNRRPIPWSRLSNEQRAFKQQISDLLRLRSDASLAQTLRYGDSHFSSIGEHTLKIARTLDDQRVEIRIAPSAHQLDLRTSTTPGWSRDHETERKLGLESRNRPYAIFVYQRNTSP
jgi:glycosidase